MKNILLIFITICSFVGFAQTQQTLTTKKYVDDILKTGTSGQVLTGAGVGSTPTWGSAVTSVSGGTTGLSFSGTGAITMAGALIPGSGGTGLATVDAYKVLVGGTVSNGALQQVANGTAGQRLTSAGSSAVPVWSGALVTAYVAKTALYTLTATDHTVEVTSGTHTQTLPTAVGIEGQEYFITNSGSGVVTVGTTSSQTFVNITATPTTITLNQFQGVTVKSNGANWIKVSGF
jgi:hypothetical protein